MNKFLIIYLHALIQIAPLIIVMLIVMAIIFIWSRNYAAKKRKEVIDKVKEEVADEVVRKMR